VRENREWKYKYKDVMKVIVEQIGDTIDLIDQEQAENLVNAIRDAAQIYLLGAGRSGFVAKGFAMRLMHLGFTTCVVGETTTPAISDKDLLITISSSGEKKSLLEIVKMARDVGVKIASVTSNPNSSLGKISDLVVVIPKVPKVEEYGSLVPLGTFFEDTTLVFTDAIISELMAILNKGEKDLKKRHTVLE
jgi:6-phospho 3-hexuloisomerase